VEGQYSGSCLYICSVEDLFAIPLWSPAERSVLGVFWSDGEQTVGLVSHTESFTSHACLKSDLSGALWNSY